MRSRTLSLTIALTVALIPIAVSVAHATHTPVASSGRITVELLNATNSPFVSLGSPQTLTLNCSASTDVDDPAGSTKCLFGGSGTTGVTVTAGGTTAGATVTIGNKTSTALAKMVASPSTTTNDLKFKNFVIKFTARTGTTPPAAVAVRLKGEFTFPEATSSNAVNTTGRAHGFSCKGNFYSCLSGTLCAAPTGDRAICSGEFVYFDDTTSSFSTENTGGLAGAAVTIDYTVSSTNSSTMASQCVAEGSTSTVCPNNPTVLTKCPTNFGICKKAENLLLNQTYKLGFNHRVEVGAGNTTTGAGPDTEENAGACAAVQTTQYSESSVLSCAIHANESLNQDSGCTHVEVYGPPASDIDLDACDFTNARFGAGGFELGPPQQINCGQDLDGQSLTGQSRKNDCLLSFCPGSQNGFADFCGATDRDVTAQLTVSCDVTISCNDAEQQGQKVKVISSTNNLPIQPTIVCEMPGVVTPCK